MKSYLLCLLVLLLEFGVANSFSSIAIASPRPRVFVDDDYDTATTTPPTTTTPPPLSPSVVAQPKTLAITPTTTYDELVSIIDACATAERPSDHLYEAVRFIEKNAPQFYPDVADKQALWERAQGCWKLVLSTGNAKTRAFHLPTYWLPFSFCMIAGDYFGNGFGWNADHIWVSVLQKHYFHPRIRQMVVTVLDIYVGGHKVTDKVPQFLKRAINVGQTPADFQQQGQRPPAFCIVAATDKALIARGNQSGALAIWKRLPQDLQPIAYKDLLTCR